ncbi:uncharacterized protein [Cherax quadricarinatus]|uniref:uncharacterized protein isoform X2 n=1 Tax=Cherax quadricarinatus TaxID=27406 RepID=UPI00387EABA5
MILLIIKMIFHISVVLPSSGLSSSVFLSSVLLAFQLVLSVTGSISTRSAVDSARYIISPKRRVLEFLEDPLRVSKTSDSAFSREDQQTFALQYKLAQEARSTLGSRSQALRPTKTTPTPQNFIWLGTTACTLKSTPHSHPKKGHISKRRSESIQTFHQERHQKSKTHDKIFLSESSLNLPGYSKFVIYAEYSHDQDISDLSKRMPHALGSANNSGTAHTDISQEPIEKKSNTSLTNDHVKARLREIKSVRENTMIDENHKIIYSPKRVYVENVPKQEYQDKQSLSGIFSSTFSKIYNRINTEEKDEIRKDAESDTSTGVLINKALPNISSTNNSDVKNNLAGTKGNSVDEIMKAMDKSLVLSNDKNVGMKTDEPLTSSDDKNQGNKITVNKITSNNNDKHQNDKTLENINISKTAANLGNNSTQDYPSLSSTSHPHFRFGVFHISPFNPDLSFDRRDQSHKGPGDALAADTDRGIDVRDDSIVKMKQPSIFKGENYKNEAVQEEQERGAEEESLRKLQQEIPVRKVSDVKFDDSEFDSHKESIKRNDAQVAKQVKIYDIYKKNKILKSGGSRRVNNLKEELSDTAKHGDPQPTTDIPSTPPEYYLQREPPAGGDSLPERDTRSDTTTATRGTGITSREVGGRSQASAVPLLDTEGSVRIPCYVIIFLLGVVGNTLVIVTLLQNRKMRTITNVFLLNLAFSDLLLGVFCMPFTLVGSLLRDFIFGPIMCRLIPYFQAVSVSVSVWTLVAISLERYYAICQPLRSRGWQTLSHAYKIISLVWLLSLVFMAPIAALSQLLPVGDTSRHKCREMWPSLHLERGFSMFLCAGLLLVPLVIMVAAYSSIIISLWHGMRLERETGQVISLTDLNGLAMVQQSLRSKNSRKHTSKISIRFRKIPAQTRICEHCGQPERNDTTEVGHVHDARTDHTHNPLADQEAGPHTCLHRRECQSYKWHVESVRENGNFESPQWKEPKNGFKRLRSTHLEKSIEAKKHVIKMLFVVVLEFFLCWTPIFVVNIMCLYIPEQVYRALGSFGISFMHLLSYASSCCNPITYCFMNKKFLQGFRHAFGCRKENERMTRQNGTAASFRSQSNNACKLALEIRKDTRETTV